MTKLDLKHLAPYLPYGLKAVKGVTRIQITAVSLELPHVYHTSYLGSRERVVSNINEVKPILRPLSDLTKEIDFNGNKIKPYIELNPLLGALDNSFFNDWRKINIENVYKFSYKIQEKLFEWHFDVFGLIEQELAIDINTLNN